MHRASSGNSPQTAVSSGVRQVIALVATRKRIPPNMITNQERCRAPAARARQLAMYLSHVVCGRSLSEVGDAFGRDRTTVSYACARIEDLRDDAHFDAEVEALERDLLGALEGEGSHAGR